MRVFLTGVTGFLGSHVAEALIHEGHEVLALARNPASLDLDLHPWTVRGLGGGGGLPPPLRLVRGSLTDARVLEEAIRGCEAVIHVAGLIQSRSESGYQAVNRDGTEAVLRACEAGVQGTLRRFVLVSSQAAGGPSRGERPVSESDPPRPVSAYGRSKLAGEERVLERAQRFPVTILRPPVVFGARDRMLARMFRTAEKGLAAAWGRGDHAFNVVHAPDVARAAVRALAIDHPSGSIFYTGDDRVETWRSFLTEVASAGGSKVRILPVPPPVFAAVAAGSTLLSWVTGRPPLLSWDKLAELREPAWLCISRAARETLGWSVATSVEQALMLTRAWYGARGLL